MAVAVLDNAVTNFATFGCVSVNSNSLLVSPELLGDANADGHVDSSDLSTVLENFGAPNSAWTSGNFDYSPTIDLTDLADILNNFGATNINASASAAPNGFTAVPEPGSLLLVVEAVASFYVFRIYRHPVTRR
jgi:hypothetical protein